MLRHGFVLIGFFVHWTTSTLAADLSRTPPPEYERILRPLLTSLDDVRARKNPYAKDHDGTVLLSEHLTYVHPDGKRLRLHHYIVTAHTPQGIRDLESDTFSFGERLTIPHLALARTVAPDGTSKPVGNDQAFIQRGRGDASSRLYDDRQEVVVIYPDVKEGSLTELIYLLEDKSARIPNEIVGGIRWTAGWPVLQRQHLYDFPEGLSQQLKEHPVGNVLAKRKMLDAPDGRKRIVWTQQNLASQRREQSQAPTYQHGPAILLSTLADWDEFARWYAGELKGRGDLNGELKGKIDEWTRGQDKPAEILATLFEKVANDVRYTGLEFGRAALQPYDCNLVWERQFGDCKDKANLLAAMLRHKGIEAWVALVNTNHAGLVHRELPSHFQFNHAIAVVNLGNGEKEELVFCDPTLSYGAPGVLSPSSADRDVLTITGESARWLKSPPQQGGRLKYDFDLKLDPAGRLAGWLTIDVEGYYTAGYASGYDGKSHDDACERLSGLVDDFFEGAEVIDIKLPKITTKGMNSLQIKAFLTTASKALDSEGRYPLLFPTPEFLIQHYGDGKDRRTPFFQWRDHVEVTTKFQLTPGWVPTALPKPLALNSAPYLAEARWSFDAEKSHCTSTLILSCRKSLVPISEVAVAAQANRALAQWVEVPLLLKRGTDSPAVPPQDGLGMPLLATGAGQLELVDRWFPLEGDARKRNQALEETIRFFPDDRLTVYEARLKLAYLLWYHDELEKAVAAYRKLAAEDPTDLVTMHALGRYMLARCLRESGQQEQAIPILTALASDESLSDHRRGWSLTLLGRCLKDDDPAGALPKLRKALAMEGGFRDEALSCLLQILLRQDELAEAANALHQHLASGEGERDEQLTTILAELRELPGALLKLPRVLEQSLKLFDEEDPRRTSIASRQEEVRKLAQQARLLPELRRELVAVLEAFKGDYFSRTAVDPNLKTREQFEELLPEIFNERDPWLATAATYFRTVEAGDRFPEFLWDLLRYLQFLEPPGSKHDLFSQVIAIAEKLPPSDDHYWEALYTKTSWLEARERWKDMVAIYSGMLDHPEFPSDYHLAAFHGRGIALEKLALWKEAVASHLQAGEERRDDLRGAHSQLRAGLLQAQLKLDEEALATWAKLKDVPVNLYEEDRLQGPIAEAILMSDRPKETRAFWVKSRHWWRDSFLPLCSKYGSDETSSGPPLLTQEELDHSEATLGTALEEKNRETVLAGARRIAKQACFLPSDLMKLHRVHYSVLKVLDSSHSEACNRSLLAYSKSLPKSPGHAPALLVGRRLEIALHLDLNEGDPCLEAIRLELARPDFHAQREHEERTLSMYGMAAERFDRQQEDASKLLIKLGESPLRFVPRQTITRHVVNLLLSVKASEEAMTFLEAQLKREDVLADESLKDKLTVQLNNLRQQISGPENFRAVVADVLKRHKPSWFDHVKPTEIGERELEWLDLLADKKAVELHAIELFKLHMLAALSPKVDPETAFISFAKALENLGQWTNSAIRKTDLFLEVLDDERLSNVIRGRLVYSRTLDALASGHHAQVERLTSHPAWNFLVDRIKKEKEQFLTVAAAIGSDSVEQVIETMQELSGNGPISRLQSGMLNDLHRVLLGIGSQDDLKKVRAMAKKWEYHPSLGFTSSDVRLHWSREARRMKPHTELTDYVLKTFQDRLQQLSKHAPPNWRDRLNFVDVDDLSSKESEGLIAIRLLEGHQDARLNALPFFRHIDWFEDAEGSPDFEALKKTIPELSKLAPTDFQRALMVAGAIQQEDLKDTQRTELLKHLKSYRDPKEHPLSFSVIRAAESLINNGDHHGFSGWKEAAKHAEIPAIPKQYELRHYYANRDLKSLEKALDQCDSRVLVSPLLLSSYLFLLETLEREEELELASETAEKALKEHMLTSWLRPDAYAASHACLLAHRLKRPELLPNAWRKDMSKGIEDQETADYLKRDLAIALEDWPSVEAICRHLISTQSRNDLRRSHAMLGTALFHQGKKKEAKQYLEKGKFHPVHSTWHNHSLELLEELESDAPGEQN